MDFQLLATYNLSTDSLANLAFKLKLPIFFFACCVVEQPLPKYLGTVTMKAIAHTRLGLIILR